jgi:hypothetical protein
MVLLDSMEGRADGVTGFGSDEGSSRASSDTTGDCSGHGRDAFGLELVVVPAVAGFDLRLGARVGTDLLRGCG